MTDLDRRLDADRELIEKALHAIFRDRKPMSNLYDAMEYSLMAGGKRIRPILTLECCRLCGGTDTAALSLACAIEMIHTYSLIHDDLPCMDDDDLRRGRPTNHKIYGEATAVLAGDGLLAAAFETALSAGAYLPAVRVTEAMSVLAVAAGPAGMVGGQALDLAGEGRSLTADELYEIHRLKTGALLTAAAELGCIAAGADGESRQAVLRYAMALGLAFQIRDDYLDVAGNEAEFGKPVGSDAANQKTTFATLKGLETCKNEVERLTQEAASALECFPDREFLTGLVWRLAGRNS